MSSVVDHPSFKIKVFGTVQGVGFRAYVKREAYALGLKGYVKNLDDGSVEIFVVGPREKVDTLIARLRSAHPPIRVTSIKLTEEASQKMFSDFVIIH